MKRNFIGLYLNCNLNKKILTTEGTANSLEVYCTSNHVNGVFKTAVHLGSGCSFERIKVTLIYDSYHYRNFKYGNIASVIIGLWNENKEVVFSKPYSHNDLYNLQVSTATIVADISVPNTRAWSMYVQVNYHPCYPVKAPEEYIWKAGASVIINQKAMEHRLKPWDAQPQVTELVRVVDS